MSKIVSAVNSMVSNPNKLSDVIVGTNDSEIFFQYDDKYNWSLAKGNESGETYYLHFYPNKTFSIKFLASVEEYEWESIKPMISYSTKELGTKEALATFKEMYSLLQEKVFGIDSVLDDIIASDDFF